jgi:hypothetical protein
MGPINFRYYKWKAFITKINYTLFAFFLVIKKHIFHANILPYDFSLKKCSFGCTLRPTGPRSRSGETRKIPSGWFFRDRGGPDFGPPVQRGPRFHYNFGWRRVINLFGIYKRFTLLYAVNQNKTINIQMLEIRVAPRCLNYMWVTFSKVAGASHEK